MISERIQLLHPYEKNAPNISLETYRLFEKSILSVLKIYQPMSFTDLVHGVKDFFIRNSIRFKGSVEWYTISVKQHLEAKGKILTFKEKGIKLHRLA